MTKLISAVIILILLLSFGCQEEMINQPTTSASDTYQKISPLNQTGLTVKAILPICCCQKDPLTGECEIKGEVISIHNTFMNIGGFFKVELSLNMDAELCTRLMSCLKYTITGCSCDTILVHEIGIINIEKCYPVENRDDIYVSVNYRVNAEGVEITSINLCPTKNY